MKKVLLYLITCIVMAGCSESVFDASRAPSMFKRYLSVSSESLSFGPEASTKSLDLESDDTPWQVTIPADWVSADVGSGNSSTKLNFSAKPNNSADTSRVSIVQVSSAVDDWNRTFPITIAQSKAAPYINLSQPSLTLDGKAQSRTVALSANVTYSISSTTDWLKIESHDMASVHFVIEENKTGNARTGQITLSATGITAALTIVQRAANISSTTSTLSFPHNASSKTLDVTSEAAWSAVSSEWIDVTPRKGQAGNAAITVNVPRNASAKARNGFVYLTIDGTNRTEIPVVQEGVTCEVSATEIAFDSFGGIQSFNITSNDNWKVASAPSWLSLSVKEGYANGTINITVNENNTTSALNGKIVLTTTDNIITREVLVTQQPKKIAFDAPTLNFSYAAGSQSFTFTTDGKWTASTQSDWFTIDKTSGAGDATITVHVDENMKLLKREGIINVNIADKSFVVYVLQDCKYVNLPSSSFTFEAEKSTTIVSLTSNTQWSAHVSDGSAWLSISPSTGRENCELAITVAENNTASARHGKITITIPGVHTYIIDVTQNHKYIKTDMSSVNFTQTGGQITFNVTTNGTYEISKIGTWFGYIKNGNAITVVAQENTDSESRTGAIILKMINLEAGEYSVMIPVAQSSH